MTFFVLGSKTLQGTLNIRVSSFVRRTPGGNTLDPLSFLGGEHCRFSVPPPLSWQVSRFEEHCIVLVVFPRQRRPHLTGRLSGSRRMMALHSIENGDCVVTGTSRRMETIVKKTTSTRSTHTPLKHRVKQHGSLHDGRSALHKISVPQNTSRIVLVEVPPHTLTFCIKRWARKLDLLTLAQDGKHLIDALSRETHVVIHHPNIVVPSGNHSRPSLFLYPLAKVGPFHLIIKL
mmetsp:Transcript_59082/g.157237  ORF Transcript_59082/g.157237 Transcript_59082/m.157237 type:complete len:232 (+) Transcript_59082:360-1055(+)